MKKIDQFFQFQAISVLDIHSNRSDASRSHLQLQVLVTKLDRGNLEALIDAIGKDIFQLFKVVIK